MSGALWAFYVNQGIQPLFLLLVLQSLSLPRLLSPCSLHSSNWQFFPNQCHFETPVQITWIPSATGNTGPGGGAESRAAGRRAAPAERPNLGAEVSARPGPQSVSTHPPAPRPERGRHPQRWLGHTAQAPDQSSGCTQGWPSAGAQGVQPIQMSQATRWEPAAAGPGPTRPRCPGCMCLTARPWARARGEPEMSRGRARDPHTQPQGVSAGALPTHLGPEPRTGQAGQRDPWPPTRQLPRPSGRSLGPGGRHHPAEHLEQAPGPYSAPVGRSPRASGLSRSVPHKLRRMGAERAPSLRVLEPQDGRKRVRQAGGV